MTLIYVRAYMIELVEARSEAEFEIAKQLFQEYIDSLGVDLSFQNVTKELENIQSIYTKPSGTLILAKNKSNWLGCIALRKYDELTCEMKRLYVKPEARGMKLGIQLTNHLFDEARRLGYQKMRLDTLPAMQAARGLYKKIGFYEIDPYYDNPIAGTTFMELSLS